MAVSPSGSIPFFSSPLSPSVSSSSSSTPSPSASMGSSSSSSVSSMIHAKIQQLMMAVKPQDLGDGTLPAQAFVAGQRVPYIGEPIPLKYLCGGGLTNRYHSFGVKLSKGQIVTVCKNQFENYQDENPAIKDDHLVTKLSDIVVRVHFAVKGTPKAEHAESELCICSDINEYTWTYGENSCYCEQTPPISPKNHSCVIL